MPIDPDLPLGYGVRGMPEDDDDRAVLLLLHGRGAPADELLGLADAVDPDGQLAHVAPEAEDHTWYPKSFLAPLEENQRALDRSRAAVNSVLASLGDREIHLLGFSQGACLACDTAARHPGRFTTLCPLTGGLIGETLDAYGAPEPGLHAGLTLRITGGHPDPHVPWARVADTAGFFEGCGAWVWVHRYPNKPHGICMEEAILVRQTLFPPEQEPG